MIAKNSTTNAFLDRIADRFIADQLGLSVDQYERRRTRNSPGQMSLFDDPATGSNLLRTSARQQSFDWDEAAHPRKPAGTGEGGQFAPKTEGAVGAEATAAFDRDEDKKEQELPEIPEAEPADEPEPKPKKEPEPGLGEDSMVTPGELPESDPAKTPRENAAAYQKKLDEDYVFARASAIPNAGEDLKGSARHIRNQWRSLEDAESNDTAEAMVVRDQLLKNEPHSLGAYTETNPIGALMLHEVLRAFPPKPGYGSRRVDEETAKKNRSNYLDAYRNIKAEAERIAASGEDRVQEISRSMGRFVSSEIKRLRAKNTTADDTANGLVNYGNSLLKFWQKSSISSKVHGFLTEAGVHDPEAPDSKAADIAAQVMEGKTFSQILGKKKESAQRKGFNEAIFYLSKAERIGGPSLGDRSANELVNYLKNEGGLRGIQFGNSVSDKEREYHAKLLAGAMVDLASVLGLPIEGISLEKSIGIAMGARCKGNVLAHYEPAKKIISLTRKNGVGTIAHEWGHALDNAIKAEGSRREFLSETLDAKGSPIADAMKSLRATWESSGYRDRLRGELQKRVNNRTISAKKANDYWNTSVEIFARTFERYIQRKLETSGRKNTYLAGIASKAYEQDGLWPTDNEAKAMEPEFDRLIDEYRKEKLKVAERVKYSQHEIDHFVDRFMADALGISVEQYAQRRAKSSPGQLGLWDDNATGSNLLRSSARQQSFDWDEKKHPRSEDGKFTEVGKGVHVKMPEAKQEPKTEPKQELSKPSQPVEINAEQKPIGFNRQLGMMSKKQAMMNLPEVGERFESKGKMYEITSVQPPRYLSRDAIEDFDEFGKEPGWHVAYTAKQVERTAEEVRKNEVKLSMKSAADSINEMASGRSKQFEGAQNMSETGSAYMPKMEWTHVAKIKTPTGGDMGTILVSGDDAYYYHGGYYDDYRTTLLKQSDPEKVKEIKSRLEAAREVLRSKKIQPQGVNYSIELSGSSLQPSKEEIEEEKAEQERARKAIEALEEAAKRRREEAAKSKPKEEPKESRSGPTSATWARLKSGAWGARIVGSASEGDRVRVTTKDGKNQWKTVKKVVQKGDGYSLAEVYEASELIADSAIVDRFMAEAAGLTIEQYAARKLKSSPGQQEFDWITVHPNGPGTTGHPVMIDKKDGTIAAGMGGKFTGQKIADVGKGEGGGGRSDDKYGKRLEEMKERRDPDGISQQPVDKAMRDDSGKIDSPKPKSQSFNWSDLPPGASRGFENNVLNPLREQVEDLDEIAKNRILGPRYAWETATKGGVKVGDPHKGSEGLKRWIDAAKKAGFSNAEQLASDNPELKSLTDRLNAHRGWGDKDEYNPNATKATKPTPGSITTSDEDEWPGRKYTPEESAKHRDSAIAKGLRRAKSTPHLETPAQAESQAQDAWHKLSNDERAQFSGYKQFGSEVGKAFDAARRGESGSSSTPANPSATKHHPFTESAMKGSIRQATGKKLPGEESASSWYELGKINGYSNEDIQKFYLGRALQSAGKLTKEDISKGFDFAIDTAVKRGDATEKIASAASAAYEKARQESATTANPAQSPEKQSATGGAGGGQGSPQNELKRLNERMDQIRELTNPMVQQEVELNKQLQEITNQKMDLRGDFGSPEWKSLDRKQNATAKKLRDVMAKMAPLNKEHSELIQRGGELINQIRSQEKAKPSTLTPATPAPSSSSFTPEMVPGQQASLFGGDDLNTGQKSLFNMVRPTKADQRAAKRDAGQTPTSLLEQIDEEERKRAESRKSLPGQGDLFGGSQSMFSAAQVDLAIERYMGSFDESKHPRDESGRFSEIKSLIKSHDEKDATNEQRRPEVEAKGIKWRDYQSARFRDSSKAQNPKAQNPKPVEKPKEKKSEIAELIEDAWRNTSAEDDGLLDVPDKWREEALFWQSEIPTESEYDQIMQDAKKWMDQDEDLTIGEALKIVMADRHGSSWYKEQQEREDQEQKEWSEKRDKILDNMELAQKEIESALKGVQFETSWGGSKYADYKGLKLRISDHPQVPGGGFNQSTGARMGESDLQAVIDENYKPRSRQEIRSAVAKQLRAERSGESEPQMFSADLADRFLEQYRAGSTTKKAERKPKTITGSKGDRGRFITVGQGEEAHPVFIPGSVKRIKETGEYRTDSSQEKAKAARKRAKTTGLKQFVPVTKVEKAIVEKVGNHATDVREFKKILDRTYSEMLSDAQDRLSAIREIMAFTGYGRNAGAFINQIKAARDYDKIPRFDQAAEFAQKQYPHILAPKMKGAGGDPEGALFALLREGIPETPTKDSPEVINAAWDRSDWDRMGMPSEWEAENEQRKREDDFVPFSARSTARVVERFSAADRSRYGAPQFARIG